jgi:flagellar basal-body rod protein FlgB
MFLTDIANSGTIPAMDKMLAFTEARHKMLLENIANIDTPYYKTKQLDPEPFQASLREAIDERKETRSSNLNMSDGEQWRTTDGGRLKITPTEEPVENILFHDRTNARVEKQMSMLAENAMMHQTMSEMLRGRYEGILKAIRGRVS